MDDYNADFLTMLETWDAAFAFWPSRDATSTQPIEIAELLGWIQDRSYGGVQMNRTGAKWMGDEESQLVRLKSLQAKQKATTNAAII